MTCNNCPEDRCNSQCASISCYEHAPVLVHAHGAGEYMPMLTDFEASIKVDMGSFYDSTLKRRVSVYLRSKLFCDSYQQWAERRYKLPRL